MTNPFNLQRITREAGGITKRETVALGPPAAPVPRARKSLVLLALAVAGTSVAFGVGAGCGGGAVRGTGGAGGTVGTTDGPGAGGGGGSDSDGGTSDAATIFEALTPAVYGTKVKNLMVGQPLTDAELMALNKDPGALRGLIDQWMALPQWRARLLGFFQQAFQQTQVTADEYNDQVGLNVNTWPTSNLIVRSAEESFARTVLQLLDEGRPFTEVLTTRRFMLNPPLMSLMAFMDAMPVDDEATPMPGASWLFRKYPTLQLAGVTDAPVTLEQMIDPLGTSFFHYYYNPTPAILMKAGCMTPPAANGYRALRAMMELLFGRHPGACGTTVPAFTAEDWDSWRMITVRPPKSGEEAATFWALPALRASTELVVTAPRVGFMTTPAFFANWMTNASNQMRVTVNQALIVGLGVSFDDRGTTVAISESASDAAHIQPGTPCYGCHQTLDPMRDFFRHSFNYGYSPQLTAVQDMIPSTGTFTVDNSAPVVGSGVVALADAMAAHNRFAIAWAQKLCRMANASSCSEDDPEFVRVANAFKGAGYAFTTLVREMFSSPLVTFTSETKSARESGMVVGVQRRETLCASLANRLGLPDVCGLHGTAGLKKAAAAQVIAQQNLAGAIPSDGYARGAETPLLPHDPNLFFASGTENLCGLLAPLVVNAGAGSRWSSTAKDAALDDFVSVVMGVPPSDGRSAALRSALDKHHTAVTAQGATATDALLSTFVLACTSPLSLSSGL